ncbi:MAG: MarR family winged helix-turn-helix transcriptional regulator [bacterium]|nr:MarR family winged helix-turn-helix transcriptional regulator [bacterium]
MNNPYLKKLKKSRGYDTLIKIDNLVPDLFELFKMLFEIQTDERFTPVKYRAALIIEKAGMISGTEFKNEIGLAQSTSSELLTRMISDGTVIKVPDKKDGRKTVFLLSEEGEDSFYRISAQRIKRIEIILQHLKEDDRKNLLKDLQSLSNIFKKLED